MEMTLAPETKRIWNHIGFPKKSGIYVLENPESNDGHFAYFDHEFKLWLQGYSEQELAKEHAVEWFLLSHENKVKNLNKMSSAWQKLTWAEI